MGAVYTIRPFGRGVCVEVVRRGRLELLVFGSHRNVMRELRRSVGIHNGWATLTSFAHWLLPDREPANTNAQGARDQDDVRKRAARLATGQHPGDGALPDA